MASHSSEPLKHTKLYAAGLGLLLIVFLLVFNRNTIMHYYFPEKKMQVKVSDAYNVARAENEWNIRHVDSMNTIVKNGDFVVVTGTDELNNSFRYFNTKDKSYSHGGLVFFENNTPMVYYVQLKKNQPDITIQRDSLSTFIAPAYNTGFSIYRFQITPKQTETLYTNVINCYKRNLAFDPAFDLSDDERMYNAEFVYKMMVAVSRDTNYFTKSELLGKEYIALDDLFLSPNAKMICKIKYKHRIQ